MTDIVRLQPAQYDELLAVQEGYRPDPEHSIVVVAKSEGGIVGRSMLIRPFHIEGTWIDERFRKGTTGPRVIRTLEHEAKAAGLTRLFAYADTPQIENYMQRLGYTKQPVSVWVKDLCH